MDYSRALEALTQRALRRDDVRALVLTGSAAAGAVHPLSDRDIEVFTTGVQALLADESWWSGLGDVLVVERLEDGDGNPTRLIYYVGGKLDFTLVPAKRLRSRTYPDPFQVLLDKDGWAATAARAARNPAGLPAQAEIDESINWAWAAALMQAKAIVRDEPWSAKLRDRDLKDELLRMIEWDHRARYGTDFDTRYLGARMRQWMDGEIQEQLEACWASFDPGETTNALVATMILYETLSERTAEALGIDVFDHARVRAELTSILSSG